MSKDASKEDKITAYTKFVKALTLLFKALKELIVAEAKTPLGNVNVLGVAFLIILALMSPFYLPYMNTTAQLFDTYAFIFMLAVLSAYLSQINLRSRKERYAYAGVDLSPSHNQDYEMRIVGRFGDNFPEHI